ncbi:MAG: glycosyltransferase family 2 protein [Candidatus Cloacimonadaceae bacterium]|nr:glycosyltransferase family 2 protein [Candidatus Cloacimonadota bacterium]MDY0299475.1 glycosyltransferase family 2 protein [Candidatus Cloacimonadaceae bacterium]
MDIISKLTVIIPIYNEEAVIPAVLPAMMSFCQMHGYNMVLVNDGSRDNSLKLISILAEGHDSIRIVSHKLNRGYGGALKSGILASNTDYSIFVDSDGQHKMEDVLNLHKRIIEEDADMIVGSRKGQRGIWYRELGKTIIRSIARILMKVPIYDINSGMKIFRTELAKNYIHLYPDSMAFSDIICLVFLHKRYLVLEEPITIEERKGGTSTIGIHTAVNTVHEILNIVTLFNPMKIFFPLSCVCVILGMIWGAFIAFQGKGLSVGSSFLIISGIILFCIGLIAEQVSQLRLK